MLFNSFEFIFIFMPIVILGGYLIKKYVKHWNARASLWLGITSLFFYAYWKLEYLPVILVSILVNYIISLLIIKSPFRKTFMLIGISFNLLYLGYYKYFSFLIANINQVFNTQFPLQEMTLPLAISFFTFQQISYIVDVYRDRNDSLSFVHYCFYILFFPQLIAGPILQLGDIRPQIGEIAKPFRSRYFAIGFFLFTIGLSKKVLLADKLSVWVQNGYDHIGLISTAEAWFSTLAYTFQIYFDFSGYSDMAIGLALLFRIELPMNFFSPYKALNIQEFWRRWHITLTRFLTKYLYIPLGGSRKSQTRTYINIFLVFFVSGIWHGAGWTFILWGIFHGIAQVVFHLWRKLNLTLHKAAAWFLTFLFVHFTWIFFRASSVGQALEMVKALFGQALNEGVKPSAIPVELVLLVAVSTILAFFTRNSMQWKDHFKPNIFFMAMTVLLFVVCLFHLQALSEFLYFNF
ncbi:MBOAT family O-acyltransferase [Metabacillus idriensis]|uniref:MBOAT family O-acyltransferase n=1 Tax=Metabacillus idriensis TaxID=324768 RepID=UPI001748283F|nr:MBOAT family O-acyltransferase [Metabacillus idriensis]